MHLTFITSIQEVSRANWQALVPEDYPFIQYDFLSLLETSGTVCDKTGWQPYHALLQEGDEVIAALPMYLKTHSYGEYVFDWSWAEAHQRYGYQYYPKLLMGIPFTPVTGPRILSRYQVEDEQHTALIQQLTATLQQHLQDMQLSSIHCIFPEQTLSQQLHNHQWLQRRSVQFHWYNRGYQDFEDFLQSFSSRKRKNVKKERLRVQQQGVVVKRLQGTALTQEHMDFFYRCYQQTYLKRSGHQGYLTEAFFAQLLSTLPDNLLLVVAEQEHIPIAAALYFRDNQQLYGRYWGSLREIDGLHFECCYYQGIEYCLEHQLQVFNPGTQGEHKIARGFEPTFCFSNHFLTFPGFQDAIENFLLQENQHIESYYTAANQQTPFKRNTEEQN